MVKYKIYIELDINNCIHKMLSTAFYTEEELNERKAIYIDEVSLEDGSDITNGQYLQNNYFVDKYDKDVLDSNGNPNFKYVSLKIQALTEEEKEELFIKPQEINAEKERQQKMLEDMMKKAQQVTFLNELPDEQASEFPYCFDSYNDDPNGFPYEKDMRREYKGQLYKCLQGYKKEKDNPTQNPDVAVSLWVLTSSEEWPEWIQPTGSHDAYDTGDKVTHNGHKYTSNIDGNTTEPGTDDRWWTLVE